MKIREHIKKHKLIKSTIIEKEIYLSTDMTYEEGDLVLVSNNGKICSSIVSLLSDYVGAGHNYRTVDLKIRCTQTLYGLLKIGNSLIQINIEHVEDEGYFVGYLLGIKYYTNSNVHPMEDGKVVEVYNGEELIGKIKWEWIQ
jgi:hypothetical protein